jgi:hypothetical protein
MTRDESKAAEHAYRVGRGNWEAFDLPLADIHAAAETWRESLDGIDKPWLCWNVQPEWSLVQQKLVAGAGWTPVVGFDPRVGWPRLVPGAVAIDFNKQLGLPVLFPHFVLEFAFLFADRLAFWHSDLLLVEADMAEFATLFESLADGEMSAVASPFGFRRLFAGNKRRYWELLGCTTRAASRSQFDNGCSWWMHFYRHPNFSDRRHRRYHWEFGCGIEYWKKQCRGQIIDIDERRLAYGHFTRINNRVYQASQSKNVFRDLKADIERNFDLNRCLSDLKLTHLLEPEPPRRP